MTYTAYVLRRKADGLFYHPGGSIHRWRDRPSAFADKGVCTRAMNVDIKDHNKLSWKPPVSPADYEILPVTLTL